MEINISRKRTRLYLLICVVGNLLLKIILLLKDVIPFNADEAVVALMARHILQGEYPIFFYGQAYMGSLDSWLVALGFFFFGEYVWVIRVIQGMLYVGVIISTFVLGRQVSGSRLVGLIASCLLAIPSITMTLYSTVSLGGYGEGLLIGNLILILGITLFRNVKAGIRIQKLKWWIWGFLVGIGLWVFGITLVYSIPMGFALLYSLIKRNNEYNEQKLSDNEFSSLILIGLGGLLGALPWWIFAFKNGFRSLIDELLGGAIAGVEAGSWIINVMRHISGFLLFGSTAIFGLRPPWEIRWLVIPLLPIVLAIWLAVIVFVYKKNRNKRLNLGEKVLIGLVFTLFAGFVFTPFGADPSGRYFLPLMIPLVIFGAEFFKNLINRYGRYAFLVPSIILIYNLIATTQCALRYPPGITTQFDSVTQIDRLYMGDLIDFLLEHNEKQGYTNYWVSYPLAFRSQEKLIFVPRLPYHQDFRYSERDDRYEPYDQIVSRAKRVAYITTNNEPLDDYLRGQFLSKGISWKEHLIGDYHVFYRLSLPIKSQEIGLGKTTKP